MPTAAIGTRNGVLVYDPQHPQYESNGYTSQESFLDQETATSLIRNPLGMLDLHKFHLSRTMLMDMHGNFTSSEMRSWPKIRARLRSRVSPRYGSSRTPIRDCSSCKINNLSYRT